MGEGRGIAGRGGLRNGRADKAALCAGLESRGGPAEVWQKEIFSRVLDFLAGNPLAELRAVRKKRHPEMPCARSRPGLRPSGGFVAYLAVDHQMTPTLFTGLFALRAPAPLTGGSAVCGMTQLTVSFFLTFLCACGGDGLYPCIIKDVFVTVSGKLGDCFNILLGTQDACTR